MTSDRTPVDRELLGPPSRGVWAALRSLAAAPRFDELPPSHRALRYASTKRWGRRPRADVWLPNGYGAHTPSVVIVHGGAFLIGSRRMKPVRYIAAELCRAGVAVMSFDYRLIFRGGRLTESLEDVAAALAWWRGEAVAHYGIDPDGISMLGLSAGAALTVLHASDQAALPLKRVVSLYGVYDFSYLSGRAAGWLRKRLLRTGDKERWRQASPLSCGGGPTPTLIVHGTYDRLAPIAHAERLVEVRQQSGWPTECVFFEGEDHGFMNHAERAATQETIVAIGRFLGVVEHEDVTP